MDEILIGEKKYVSSKQAAKVTGYAKDYIGQLCREGRVPARLVGRSWYVLETAIHDHRFGEERTEQEIQDIEPEPSVFSPTWESPRYEASSAEVLPSVNRLRDAEESEQEGISEASQHLQDSWKDWFDRIANPEPPQPVVPDIEPQIRRESQEKPVIDEIKEVEKKEYEEEEVSIPVHTVYNLPPEELLPRHHAAIRHIEAELLEDTSERQEEEKAQRVVRGATRVIQVAGGVLAVVMVIAAAVGTGYFDKYIISNSQAQLIAGVALYNR